MSVKKFLRMMPQIDRKYLDEAYRVTAGRKTDKPKWGVIMKKVTKIAVAAALCVGVIAGGAALIYKLNHRFDVSPNPHGSGYAGNAPETVKFRASLSGGSGSTLRFGAQLAHDPVGELEYELSGDDGARLPGNPQYFRSAAYTENGWYYIGVPGAGDSTTGICYYDIGSGQSMYLCAKPECLHDGSDYCPATNADYTVKQLVYYDGMLYAAAVRAADDGASDIPEGMEEWDVFDTVPAGVSVLLKIQPDGTGLDEIATLDTRGSFESVELIAHRGALWIAGTVGQRVPGETVAGARGVPFQRFYSVWHYDLKKDALTAVSTGKCNSALGVSNLQADGDAVYFVKRSDALTQRAVTGNPNRIVFPAESLDGLEAGLYEVSAKNGTVRRLAQEPCSGFYLASGGRLFWITAEKNEDSYSYFLHTQQGSDETSVRVPRADHYYTDGTYLLADCDGSTLTVLDTEGNVLRREQFPTEADELDERYRSEKNYLYSFGYADGVIYRIRRLTVPESGSTPVHTVYTYSSVRAEDFAGGSADFADFMKTYQTFSAD